MKRALPVAIVAALSACAPDIEQIDVDENGDPYPHDVYLFKAKDEQ